MSGAQVKADYELDFDRGSLDLDFVAEKQSSHFERKAICCNEEIKWYKKLVQPNSSTIKKENKEG